MATRSAYVSLKDHKEHFTSNPKCRLINPAKSEIGLMSKRIISNINDKIRRATHLNQWKNSSSVIGWFNNIIYKKEI